MCLSYTHTSIFIAAELQVQVLALGTDAVPADGVTVMESGGPRHVAYTLVSQRGVGEGVVVRGTITTQEGSAKGQTHWKIIFPNATVSRSGD